LSEDKMLHPFQALLAESPIKPVLKSRA